MIHDFITCQRNETRQDHTVVFNLGIFYQFKLSKLYLTPKIFVSKPNNTYTPNRCFAYKKRLKFWLNCLLWTKPNKTDLVITIKSIIIYQLILFNLLQG